MQSHCGWSLLMSDMVKAVGYVRLSQKSDVSIKSQIEDVKQYCNKNNIELIQMFNEGEGQSGYDSTREQYNKMLEYIDESSEISMIIVRDKSRFGRDRFERLERMLELRRKHNVKIVGVSDNFNVDLDDDYGVIIASIDATTDDVGKRREIEKSKEEIKKRIRKGFWQGRPPFGFRVDAQKQYLEPNDKFETALEVIRLRDEGKTYQEIKNITGVNLSVAFNIYKRRNIYKK